MPKYYCDYCDTFLTHDSPSVRKTHNGGRKHKENVRMYYQTWMEQQAQKLVDATTRAFTQQQRLGANRPPVAPVVQPPVPVSQFPYPSAIPRPTPLPTVPPIGLAQIPRLPTIPASFQQMPPSFPGGIIPPLPSMPYNANQ
uniref:U1 small nuclear ribonucleoprotein C n=1 Tax=Panagrolaimus sp. JU765 TaxID=591449 RepID=A0AC34QCW2_9BILA